MADPTTSNPIPETPGPTVRVGHTVGGTQAQFAGGFAALAGNLAVGTPGFAVNLDNLVGILPLGGQWSDQATGDGSVENNADGSGRILKRVVVTGITNNATDLGKVVFADSAGPPLVLADPGNSLPFGVVLDVVTATDADIWQFGLEASLVLGLLSRSVYDTGVGGGEWTSWGTDAGNP